MSESNKNGIARKIFPIIHSHYAGSEQYDFKLCRQIVSIVKNELLNGGAATEIMQHLTNNGFTVNVRRDANNIYLVECSKKGNVLLKGQGETVDLAFQSAVSDLDVNGWLGMSRV